MIAHLANSGCNDGPLQLIEYKLRRFKAGFFVFEDLLVRRHVRCAIAIVMAPIYRTTFLTV
jgi:hypothetical protein